jgi:hypothetical protein
MVLPSESWYGEYPAEVRRRYDLQRTVNGGSRLQHNSNVLTGVLLHEDCGGISRGLAIAGIVYIVITDGDKLPDIVNCQTRFSASGMKLGIASGGAQTLRYIGVVCGRRSSVQ